MKKNYSGRHRNTKVHETTLNSYMLTVCLTWKKKVARNIQPIKTES